MTRQPCLPELSPPALKHVPDEFSEIIDSRSRDLDAEQLCSALEDLCTVLENERELVPSRCSHLKRELLDIIRCRRDEVAYDSLLEGLERLVCDLRSGSIEPDVALTPGPEADEPPELELIFDSAFSLRRKMPDLFDICGGFLETDIRPMPLIDMPVLIQADPLDEQVSLEGRVVRSAPNGIAVRLYHPARPTLEHLHRLHEEIWRAHIDSDDEAS